MRVVLILFTLNHLVYLYFDRFIEGVMSNVTTAAQAPGYGLAYGVIIFPIQFLLELVLFAALLYQVFVVRQWRANLVLWLACIGTFFSIVSIGY
ncbi:hypothetical protein ACPV40_02210 [Vibrio alfacsensis]|uniref:hypothetical protein n=1 Tax=Vibrio alfacsensis TaxID=1074311 RepID=UPI0040686B17